jgi:hypothetical protein
MHQVVTSLAATGSMKRRKINADLSEQLAYLFVFLALDSLSFNLT